MKVVVRVVVPVGAGFCANAEYDSGATARIEQIVVTPDRILFISTIPVG